MATDRSVTEQGRSPALPDREVAGLVDRPLVILLGDRRAAAPNLRHNKAIFTVP